METLLITLLVVSAVGFIASIGLAKNIANSTGKDLFNGFFRKFLMAVGGLGIMGFMSIGEEAGALPIALVMTIGALVILFLHNIKKEVPIAKIIILTVLEVLSGFIMVLVWGLSIMMKMFSGGSFTSFDVGATIKKAQEEYNNRTYVGEIYNIDNL